MPQYTAPGVYIEEIELGPPPITGVSTSTAGFIGVARKGPVNKPMLVAGIGDFERIFGNHLPSSFGDKRWLMYAVQGFFENGGQTAYVTRVAKLPQDLKADTDRSKFAWTARTVIPDRAAALRTLQSDTLAGGTELDLGFLSGIADDSVLVIGDGVDAESVLVTGFTDKVQIQPALANAHPAGTPVAVEPAPSGPAATTLKDTETYAVGAPHVRLADPGAASANDWLLIEGGGGNAEVARVTAIDAGTGDVTLGAALTKAHAVGAAAQAFTEGTPVGHVQNGPIGPGASSVVEVEAAATFAQNDWVLVGGTTPEIIQVTAFGAGAGAGGHNTVTLTLAAAHATNDPVTKLTPKTATTLARGLLLQLAAAGGLHSGDFVVLWDADPTKRELVRLAADPTSTFFAPITAPLQSAHAAGTEVRKVTAGGTAPPTLAAGAAIGDMEIQVSDATQFPQDSVLEISGAGGQTEYAYVTGPGSGANKLALQSAVRFRHTSGATARPLSGALYVLAGPGDPDPSIWPEVGEWGNEISIDVLPAAIATTEVKTKATTGDLYLDLVSVNGIEPGTILALPDNRHAVVDHVVGTRAYLAGTSGVPADIDPAAATPQTPWVKRVTSVEFSLAISYGPASELWLNLSLDPRHSRFVETIVNSARGSQLVRVRRHKPSGQPVGAADLPLLTTGWQPGGGSDPLSAIDDVVLIGADSADADRRTGLYAFLNVDDVSMIAAPGWTSQVVQSALYNQCELTKYCFAVLDSIPASSLDGVQVQRGLYDSKYGALYYPWIQIFDTLENKNVFAPPSGHMMGIYARTDTEVGVHEAPANQVVAGALDLERPIGKAQQGVLNPKGINAIRALPGRGIRVWGARTISSDALWRYVNVRRLFIFLEESIDRSTQYAVFRPNDVPLWNGLRATVSAFLTTVWRSGALQGRTRDEAFFVRVGLGETMSQQDIDEGRVIILIGVAPVKPAEFVVFRIGQKAGGATVTE